MAMNAVYKDYSDLPVSIPVFPLPRALLLPRTELPLQIFETRYVDMIDDALKGERIIGMIQPLRATDDDAPTRDLMPIGCAGRITSLMEAGDNRYHIALTGICRFAVISELERKSSYRCCSVTYEPFATDLKEGLGEADVDRGMLLRVFRDYLEANELQTDWREVENTKTEAMVNILSIMAPYGVAEKQALLEAPDLVTRAETLIALTERALAMQDSDNPQSTLQ